MATFIKLEDSPMFKKQLHSLEQTADDLRDRCQKLYKGATKFMAVLGEAIDGDTAFADSVEAFACGDDPTSISIGGPVISKFITAFHELSSYKELLRSQVEHVLVDRLMNFISVDLQEAKDSRRRFDKAAYSYDQAREKFVSLKKSTPEETVAELEEDLQNSKSTFDRSRFNLVHVLMNIEAKKKFEFLESISVIMDAHLRYFKLGYELLKQMEPFIHQVLTYAQQSKEMALVEQDRLATRIQEFRTQAELDNSQDSIYPEKTATSDGIQAAAGGSCKKVEAMMQATATTSGEVQTIRQGYLLKRSSSSRGDWKRRFFVLDSHGTLYYYKNNNVKHAGFHSHHSTSSFDNHSSVFGRFRTKHVRASSVGEETLDYRVVDLRTSTLKIDADDSNLRLCFRIISPRKTYTLQAENEADWRDWMNKIKGVIASLLSSHFLQQPFLGPKRPGRIRATGDGSQSVPSPGKSENYRNSDDVAITLRSIPGNDICAECSSPDPDWASLNLGVLLCIECSGIHRNFGVHISKVRSITLDVKVWDPTVLELFRNLGNTYCNSIWEGGLLLQEETREDEGDGVVTPIKKPSPGDPTHLKEKFVHAKYVEKRLVAIDEDGFENRKKRIWKAVESNNLREVYRLIVTSSDRSIVNTVFDEAVGEDDLDSGETRQDDLHGFSLLHLACHLGNLVMIELLLQFGADINFQDFSGKTPLHRCISMRSNSLAKVLLKRGARASIKDGGGQSVLERAMEMGAITDEELFILLAEC